MTHPAALDHAADALPYKLVTHRHPDTDALACLWAASRIVAKDAEQRIVFQDAGLRLPPEEEEGFEVLYLDTGGSDTDQHGMNLKRGSSFQLLAEKYRFANDPGIAPIVELTRATDNVEKISPTDVHYLLKGLHHHFRKGGETDWEAVVDHAFLFFDILSGQARYRAKSVREFKDQGHVTALPNGRSVAAIWWKPHLREAAYDAGHDIVIWSKRQGKNGVSIQIQVNRDSDIRLDQVAAEIRNAEARKRGIAVNRGKLFASRADEAGVPGWFLHDSGKYLCCGTRSHPLPPEELSVLSTREVLNILLAQAGRLPAKRAT